jgi:hypothetical protein
MKFITAILFLSFFITGVNYADDKLLSLTAVDRTLFIDDKSSNDYFLCLMENKKVFGKNHAKTSDCYSLKEQDLRNSFETFNADSVESEIQLGFYSSEGKQVFPYWEENGFRFSIQSFVILPNSKFFVQAIRKDAKQYFYLRTSVNGWEISK